MKSLPVIWWGMKPHQGNGVGQDHWVQSMVLHDKHRHDKDELWFLKDSISNCDKERGMNVLCGTYTLRTLSLRLDVAKVKESMSDRDMRHKVSWEHNKDAKSLPVIWWGTKPHQGNGVGQDHWIRSMVLHNKHSDKDKPWFLKDSVSNHDEEREICCAVRTHWGR